MAGFTVFERDGSPFWWAQASIGVGKPRRWKESTGLVVGECSRETAAQKAAALWLAECRRRGAPVQAQGLVDLQTMVRLYGERDLAARARKRHDGFLERELGRLVKHLERRFIAVSEITAEAWQDRIDELHGVGTTLRTIQTVTSTVRGFLAFCRREGAIAQEPELPCPSAEEVAAEQKERRPFTEEERDKLLRVLARKDRRACRIYVVMFYTLLRKGTVEKLRLRWIDRKTGLVRFPARSIKSRKKNRAIYLHPKALAAVRAQVAANGSIDPDRPIFGAFDFRAKSREKGKREGGLFWDSVDEAGIDREGLVPHHVARHTGATLMVEAGADIGTLKAQGLWDSTAAAERYVHVHAELTKKTAALL